MNEKELFQIYNENRDLKENRQALIEKIQELEKLINPIEVNIN
jgi:hypothetical protein